MKINNLKKLALVGFAPFMMTGCTQMNVTEEQLTTESVNQSIGNTYDIEASVRQTNDGIKIECNNPIVENILKNVLPYDLSKLNIETLSITRFNQIDKRCSIDISGKKDTTYKYKAEELLDNILNDLISNNICDENDISLYLSNFEFDANTHFPNKLSSFCASNCSGLLSENELKSDFSSLWFWKCDIFLLDNDHSYPKVEYIWYTKHDRTLDVSSEPIYLQQSLDYFASKYDADKISISASYDYIYDDYIYDASYVVDLYSITKPVEIYMDSDIPSTFEVKNASDISFDLCVNDGKYDKEKSQFFNSLAKEQLETNERIDVAVSCIGGDPVIDIGPSKRLRK